VDILLPSVASIKGLDPLYVVNKGKLIAILESDAADAIVERMRRNPFGQETCIIGEVKPEPRGILSMITGFGGTRSVDTLTGERLPRIVC
jgi:hydrogenase expression/formation protein HypE